MSLIFSHTHVFRCLLQLDKSFTSFDLVSWRDSLTSCDLLTLADSLGFSPLCMLFGVVSVSERTVQDKHVCVWQHVSGRNYQRRRSRGGIRGGAHHQGQTDGAAATRHPRCCPFCRTQGLLGLLSLRPVPTLCRLWKHVSCLVLWSCLVWHLQSAPQSIPHTSMYKMRLVVLSPRRLSPPCRVASAVSCLVCCALENLRRHLFRTYLCKMVCVLTCDAD